MAENACSAMSKAAPIPALRQLEMLADARKRELHPTVPYLVKSKFSDKTANGLTKCIILWFGLQGHSVTRFDSTGSYRADLGRFVPSKQKPGHPDVLACVRRQFVNQFVGQYVAVEVKVGKDRLSADQRECIASLTASGAKVLVCSSFQQFFDWYQAEFEALPFP
jgi:hypothetical protein